MGSRRRETHDTGYPAVQARVCLADAAVEVVGLFAVQLSTVAGPHSPAPLNGAGRGGCNRRYRDASLLGVQALATVVLVVVPTARVASRQMHSLHLVVLGATTAIAAYSAACMRLPCNRPPGGRAPPSAWLAGRGHIGIWGLSTFDMVYGHRWPSDPPNSAARSTLWIGPCSTDRYQTRPVPSDHVRGRLVSRHGQCHLQSDDNHVGICVGLAT